MSGCPFNFSRRGFLGIAGAVAAVGAGFGARGLVDNGKLGSNGLSGSAASEPFWGAHQSGIITPAQNHTYFAAFDLVTDKRDEVIKLLQKWTNAAARMSQGLEAGEDVADGSPDSGDVQGLPPSRLTITFGFGPGLFTKDGKDRYGLVAKRPAALVDMPAFSGDQLVPERTGGDLSIQACADDPQVAFHAIRQLVRLADSIAQIRWTQVGFIANQAGGGTARNLMGFKDGTGNPDATNTALMDKFIWAGSEAPDWMQGGSYVVARRARIALEHWDKMKTSFQEQTVGRQKASGAPIGKQKEFDKADLNAVDADGNLVIAENSHLRVATAETNDGAQILRRSYSYNEGVSFTAERWPPWKQGMEYDAGLLFMCYQRDPRTGFIKIFDKMSKFDMMNQFVTHIGGGLFACPGGARDGEFIGQRLFQTT
ncbi:MAG: iron uptake transporter deferrochelatase/peroxidase subunit [Alphaproteobacteria bacterium]